jgi:formylglycine-generating enzyme required for sulfatase activity
MYDMSGNVWEWCRDWYGPYQIQRIIHDPTGPKNKYERVIRGGSIGDEERSCRVANRERMKPTKHNPAVGFRVVLVRRQ